MSGTVETARRLFQRTIHRNRLLEPGERFVVAVSGGADSFCLLHLLHNHNQRTNQRWQILPVHIDPGFAN